MEALGRTIAVILSVVGIVFGIFFYKTSSIQWQKNETVRNMGNAFAKQVIQEKEFLYADWVSFQNNLSSLGEYHTEISIYERRRFEGESGRVYLYHEEEPKENRMLSEGSFVRVVVTEEKGRIGTVLYGGGCTVIAGGRIS